MSSSVVKLSIKCTIFFRRATPIVVQATDFNTLLMLHKSKKNVIYDEKTTGAIFSAFDTDNIAFGNRKTWKISSDWADCSITHIDDLSDNDSQMNRMDSVEGQASCSDERYLSLAVINKNALFQIICEKLR